MSDYLSISPADYAALDLLPTLAPGHDADLKIDAQNMPEMIAAGWPERWAGRIWLPRVTDADIEHYDMPPCPVEVEVRGTGDDDRWTPGDQKNLDTLLDFAREAGLL